MWKQAPNQISNARAHDERRNRTIYEILSLQVSLLFAFLSFSSVHLLFILWFDERQKKEKQNTYKAQQNYGFYLKIVSLYLLNMEIELSLSKMPK